MTAWRIAAAALTVAVAACAPVLPPGGRPDPHAGVPAHVRVRLPDGGIRRIPLDEYVRGSVLSEVSPASGDLALAGRMLEVQAVIARSYAAANLMRHGREGFDLCSTTHCQVYQPARVKTSPWAAAAAEAVNQTSGLVLWHGSAPATALFHADCGGRTSDAADVWGGMARPYLGGGPDDGPAASAHAAWRFEIGAAELTDALNDDPRTRVGARITNIAVVERDPAGRARLVALRSPRDPLVRGEELRTVLTRAFGPRSVRSTKFEVAREGARFVFRGQGFGHGVGLCQAGALARLKAGDAPRQVLARYYPGTELR